MDLKAFRGLVIEVHWDISLNLADIVPEETRCGDGNDISTGQFKSSPSWSFASWNELEVDEE